MENLDSKLKIPEVTHRRYNPLTGEWILVAPGRIKRPWQGKVERLSAPSLPAYDPDCYLCPRNRRASGQVNPDYSKTFVFDNDFSSLSHDTPDFKVMEKGVIRAESEQGICRVICFSPRHDLTLAEMTTNEIRNVLGIWKSEYESLGTLDDVNHVQIFENKGELMGCSNPHPHCQVWAQRSIPVETLKESLNFERGVAENGKCILCEYLDFELKDRERVVFENDSFVALIPFWAAWPFEAMILPKKHTRDISRLSGTSLDDYAGAIKDLTVRYDNLFEVPFPYSSGIHQSPTDGKPHEEWHFHMHFYPPLLRSATVKKFMVGYEMLANPQRDVTPEQAAERLRTLSKVHYKQR